MKRESTGLKVLIIRLSSLGDIILTFPLLYKIRRQHPDLEIDFATKKEYEEAVLLTGMTNSIITPAGSLKEFRREINSRKYDHIVDLHNVPKSIYLRAFNAKVINSVSKDHFKKFVLVNGGIDLFGEPVPVFRKYLIAANELIENESTEFETGNLREMQTELPESEYIVVAPCSRHFTKTYPREKFIDFIRATGDIHTLLVGSSSPADIENCRHIADQCKNATDVCGKLSLQQLVFVLRRAKAVVTNDSAVMHLSEAAGKDVTAIFGGTVRQFGFFPQLPKSKVLEQAGLSCRPCSHIGLSECPRLTFDCMNNIRLIKEINLNT